MQKSTEAEEPAASPERSGPHDAAVRRLQALRAAAGEPSYAEIARAVGQVRISRGVSESAALPARTTVYDAFRLGRRRLDRELVDDITHVLTVRSAEQSRWAEPRAQAVPEQPVRSAPVVPAVVPAVVPVIEVPDAVPDAVPEPAPAPSAETEAGAGESPAAAGPSDGPRGLRLLFFLVLCLVINILGMDMMRWLDLPIYLDMIGTGLAAVALGPWWGVLVGVSAAGVHDVFKGVSTLPFAHVAAAGALIWGYGARRRGAATSIARFLRLTWTVSWVCTLLSLPPLFWMMDRWLSHPNAPVTEAVLEFLPFWLAVLVANGFFVAVDKLVTAFVVLGWLDARRQRWPWVTQLLEREHR